MFLDLVDVKQELSGRKEATFVLSSTQTHTQTYAPSLPSYQRLREITLRDMWVLWSIIQQVDLLIQKISDQLWAYRFPLLSQLYQDSLDGFAVDHEQVFSWMF